MKRLKLFHEEIRIMNKVRVESGWRRIRVFVCDCEFGHFESLCSVCSIHNSKLN
jgi:hypothetical protein